jgi:CelD/BcsL family acetyltransferase involved in cellulose biosynthesis
MSYAVARQELADLKEEWLILLDGGRAAKVFQHPRWQQTWLEEFQGDRQPLLLSVRDGARLLAVAPLLREGMRLSLIGDYNICDYMDFVMARGQEEEVLSVLLDALEGEGWTELELRGLAASSPTLALLPSLAGDRGLEVRVEREAVCPQLDLPSTWEDYLTQLGKKNRHELRRKMRRLYSTAVSVRLLALRTPSEVGEGMGALLRLMTLKSDKAQFMTPQMERFFQRVAVALAEEGLIALYMLEMDGRRVASALCFEDENEVLLYNSGYDPELSYLSVGLISKALLLRSAIEGGRRHLDFLRGNEPYKYDLGGRDVEVHRCLIRRP